ncbi:phosphate ABC transporter permease, partial [Vibrio sp. 10N.261.48.A2]
EYSAPVLQKDRVVQPKITQIELPEPFLKSDESNGAIIDQFVFSKNARGITVVAQLSDQRVIVKWYQSDLAGDYVFKNSQWLSNKLGLQQQLLVTPDGRTIYLRSQSDLAVLKLSDTGFNVREVIDLSLNDAKH